MTNEKVNNLSEDFIQSFLRGAFERVSRKIRRKLFAKSWYDLSEDDLVQDVLLQLQRSLHNVDVRKIDDDLEKYCYGIENHCISDAFRNTIRTKKSEPLDLDVPVDELTKSDINTANQDDIAELIQAISNHLTLVEIGKLLETEIRTFPSSAMNIMRRLITYGYSERQVAEEMGCSLSYIYKIRAQYLPRLRNPLYRRWEELSNE